MKGIRIFISGSVVMFCMIIFSETASAATYYVRTDGGTSTQCTGLADAAYSGSGTNQPCAVNHPFWLLPPSGTPIFRGGDTLIIGQGQYQIGLGAPNTPTCNPNWSYDCLMATVPAGPSLDNKTKIYGKGWDTGCPSKPQLWGNERVWNVMTVGSNTEVQCLEITDHSACIESGPSDGTVGEFPVKCERNTPPFGPWAGYGLAVGTTSTNVILKNLDIHGLANGGISADRVGNIDLGYVNIIANGWRGWEGDGPSADDSYTGTINFSHGKIEWNGCSEKYPLTTPNPSSSSIDKHHCWEQQQGGYGDGIALGDGSPGNWVITDSSISWNTSDGVDLAHGNGNSTIKFIRSKAEGNNGNQFKSTGNAYVENSVLIGNCGFFQGQPFTSTKDTAGADVQMNYCRAMGQTMNINVPLTSNRVYISNNTILGNGDTLWMLAGAGCSGTTKSVILRNNIFYGGDDWRYNYDNSPNREQSGFFWTEGSCTSTHIDEDYNIVYLTKSNNSGCVGTHSKCGADPLFAGTIKQGPTGNYYIGSNYVQQVTLQADSPAINASNTNITLSGSSNDYLNIIRGPQWDMGAYEYLPTASFSSCNTVTTSNFSQAAYNAYGAPFDAFQTSTNLLDAKCTSSDTHTVNLTTGITGDTTRIVYTKGYWYDATTTAWRQYTGTCTGALNGEWCQGSVSAIITSPNLSTASAANPTYLVGMTCSVQGGSWKCGCRDTTCANFYWQVQGAGQ